jgi:hypothetical protein
VKRPSGTRRGRLLLRFGCALAVLLAPATFPLTSASFAASTADDANSASAATISPPSALAVTQQCTTTPAPVYRTATGGSTGSNSLTISTPAGIQAGDLLIAVIANRDSWPLPTPAGWNLIRRDSNGTVIQAALFYRVATASEPAGVTFTLTGASNSQMAGGIMAYSGVNATSPIGSSGVANGSGTTASTPSQTTTGSNRLALHLLTKRQEALPAPAGTTSRGSIGGSGANSVGLTAADEVVAAPGSTPSRSATSTTAFASEWLGQAVVIRPVAGTPSASASWTATPSSWATGYLFERLLGGTTQSSQTITPVTTTSATDGPLVNGTAYTYRVRSYRGTWNSVWVTAALTPSC